MNSEDIQKLQYGDFVRFYPNHPDDRKIGDMPSKVLKVTKNNLTLWNILGGKKVIYKISRINIVNLMKTDLNKKEEFQKLLIKSIKDEIKQCRKRSIYLKKALTKVK